MEKTLYQTLEDRDNVEVVERKGPFLCRRQKAWLGEGYYYWDTFIEYAHWWGQTSYQRNGYVICKTVIKFKDGELYDLEDLETLKEFNQIGVMLAKHYGQDVTVPMVINYLKENTSFKYRAVRARANGATNDYSLPVHRMQYIEKNKAYLDTMPQIQVCILDITIVGQDNFHVVYPPEYVDGYGI